MHDHPTIKMVNGKVKGSTAKADALSKKMSGKKVGQEIHKKQGIAGKDYKNPAPPMSTTSRFAGQIHR